MCVIRLSVCILKLSRYKFISKPSWRWLGNKDVSLETRLLFSGDPGSDDEPSPELPLSLSSITVCKGKNHITSNAESQKKSSWQKNDVYVS